MTAERLTLCEVCGTTIESSNRTRWQWTHIQAPLAVTAGHKARPWNEAAYEKPIFNRTSGDIATQGAT